MQCRSRPKSFPVTTTWICGSPEVRYWIMADVTSSSSTSLKPAVGKRCTLNLSRSQTSSRWCGVVVRRGVPAQMSSSSLDNGSK
ncbi:hypothetical protein TNCV_964711 [Trichonephila clavipes]|nr:hypothetical protein TNCV_964711 [Trichonephila clavipes]